MVSKRRLTLDILKNADWRGNIMIIYVFTEVGILHDNKEIAEKGHRREIQGKGE